MPCKSAVTVGQSGICRSIVWIAVNRLLKVLLCLLYAIAGSFVPVVAALQIRHVGFSHWLARIQTRLLLFSESDVNLTCDASHDRVLHGQNVFEFTVVTLCPKVCLALGIDQLHGDADTVRPASNTALNKIVSVQFSTNLPRGQLALFVLCSGTASYYGQLIPVQFSELGKQLGQPRTEKLLVEALGSNSREGQDS